MKVQISALCSHSRGVLFALLCMMWGALSSVWVSCADALDDDLPTTSGTLTLQLRTGAYAATRATQDGDAEYYMQDVYIFFFRSDDTDDTPSTYACHRRVAAYGQTTLTPFLSDRTIETLFDGTDQCRIYVVANMPAAETESDGGILADTQYSIRQLQNMVAPTIEIEDNRQMVSAGLFAMDGLATVTLDRATMLMTGEVTLTRALVKITLDLTLEPQIEVDGKSYEPEADADQIGVELYNCAMQGLLHGLAEDYDARALTSHILGSYLSVTTSAGAGADVPSFSLQTPFYSYPNEWVSNADGDHVTTLNLKVGWREMSATDDEVNFQPYYYQVPINFSNMRLERNTHYRIRLHVGMLGSTTESQPVAVDACDYEVLRWGMDDVNIEAELSRTHYLVAEDNTFTIWNEDTRSFSYNSCSGLTDVVLTKATYESTKTNSTVTLYERPYVDGAYGTATLFSNSTQNQQAVDVAQTIESRASSAITYSSDLSEDYDVGGAGTITFTMPVSETSAVLYHPITYTLVLVNGHGGLRQTVTIVQYPSKYITYGAGGDAFVNGYYAMKNGATNKSYGFAYAGWTESAGTYSGSSYDGYYRSSTNYETNSSGNIYGYTGGSTNFTTSTEYNAVNTSYEYLRGNLSNYISFANTIDVSVSAFSADDNSFEVWVKKNNQYTVPGGFALQQEGKSYNSYGASYIIGDPRQEGGYSSDIAHDGTYAYSGDALYEYYVGGTQTSGSYTRYVKSWGDKASKIMIGGTDQTYDFIIAPMFKVQSSYGATCGEHYYEVAQKRCATYQEAGYPAGRWRLPTLAECAFLTRLQSEGVIDQLFIIQNNSTMSGKYFCSSGGMVAYSTDNEITYIPQGHPDNNEKAFTRCVYDVWYWGNTPMSTTEYHPEP